MNSNPALDAVYDLLPTTITLMIFAFFAPFLVGTADYLTVLFAPSMILTARLFIILLFVIPSEYHFSRGNIPSVATTAVIAFLTALMPPLGIFFFAMILLSFKILYKR